MRERSLKTLLRPAALTMALLPFTVHAQFGRGGPAPDIELSSIRSAPAETMAVAFADAGE
jgi:hypothetical protein